MSTIRKTAQFIRHHPLLEQADSLWHLLRKPYHRLINLSGRGAKVTVGSICPVRIPPEFTGGYWEAYEPEAIKAVVSWLAANPDALFLDVGCAVGIVSVTALNASERVDVIAFDSDLGSLKATQRMCQFAPRAERLRVVYGFVSDCHLSGRSLKGAVEDTLAKVDSSFISGDPGTTQYVCVSDDADRNIPTNSLDGLFATLPARTKPMLIKCDVEGAELLVLKGARKLLQESSPVLLLSVHPPALPRYGHSVEMLKQHLTNIGYDWTLIAVDHEEHWWCTRQVEQP
jgi:FkbM family methyltransferase